MGLELDHDVLGLEVGVDDVAVLVQVRKPQQSVKRDLLDQPQRHPLLVELIVLDHVQQVRPQNLKHRTIVLPVDPVMREVVQQQQGPAEIGLDQLGVLLLLCFQELQP